MKILGALIIQPITPETLAHVIKKGLPEIIRFARKLHIS